MAQPTTPTGGPPSYSTAPPSYTGTPNQSTPTNAPNNGSTMRLLSSQDETEYRPYVSPMISPTAHSGSRRKPLMEKSGALKLHGFNPLRHLTPSARNATSPQWSTSAPAGQETSRKRRAIARVRYSRQSLPSEPKHRPLSPRRSYQPAPSTASSISRPHSPSILDTAPRLVPSVEDGHSYLPFIPARNSPTRSSNSLSRTSSESSRPPPSDIAYEPADLHGSPRPGTPSSRYGGSPKRPLPPAPLFSGPQAAGQSCDNLADATTIPIDQDEDDVFSPKPNNPRASLKSYDSFQSQTTFTEDLYSKENEDHYGPAPIGRQERRRGARQAHMAKKEVRLINGELILECKIPTILYSFLPRRDDVEFTHMRYTAVTCDPDDFCLRGYKLRQNIGNTSRDTELFICVTMYNEDEIDFTRTMHGVMKNIAHFCSRTKSRTWGKDGWQKIVVCIVSDGRRKVHPRTLDALAAMGVYQDGIAKNLVNQKEVTAHVYEYTTQVSLDPDLKFKGAEKGIVPCQMIFCLKEKNQKKLNSHRWFFNAFGRALTPNVCILLDVGTKPGDTSLYHLWKAFDTDSNVAGACGEIKAAKGKGWLGLLNPLVASQNFEYKMSNILDKPLESVFGYITVLPGALSAYRYYALQNDATGHGPLSQYFKGETLHGQDADVFTANMYLAEDRILCWELVAKRDERWVLKYVKSATGETDVPGRSIICLSETIDLHLSDATPEFISQRRRWLNGAFFAAVYSLVHFKQVWHTDHTLWRKILLHIEFVYQFVSLAFTFFSLVSTNSNQDLIVAKTSQGKFLPHLLLYSRLAIRPKARSVRS